jgi:hypothetical protein
MNYTATIDDQFTIAMVSVTTTSTKAGAREDQA